MSTAFTAASVIAAIAAGMSVATFLAAVLLAKLTCDTDEYSEE